MKVLTGCEYSGIVASAFRSKGHEAFSCDIVPGNIPEFHFQGDIFDVVSFFNPELLIAFPPCTYLCKAQFHLLHSSPGRYDLTKSAADFVHKIFSLPIPKIAIENPIGCLPDFIGNYSQLTYSNYFGDPHKKDICLWLKNLPPLISTCYNPRCQPVHNHVNGRMSRVQKSHIKSKFFPGVGEAMANQWS